MAQNSHAINTAGNTFCPGSSLAINVGDTVPWNNTQEDYHNVNATISNLS